MASSGMSSGKAFGGKPWFRTLAESTPALVWASDPDGLCTYFNSGWLQFTGRTFEESPGNGWLSDVHPNDSQRVMNEYTGALRSRSKFRLEYRLRNKGGRYKRIVDFGGPVFSSDGSFQGYIGSCTDAFDPRSGGRETRWRQEYESALAGSDRGGPSGTDRKRRNCHSRQARASIGRRRTIHAARMCCDFTRIEKGHAWILGRPTRLFARESPRPASARPGRGIQKEIACTFFECKALRDSTGSSRIFGRQQPQYSA